MSDLSGRVALVTGAARGIGRACAIRLAKAGADVVVNYKSSRAAAEEVARGIQQGGRQAPVVKADVSEPEDVAAMMEYVQERFGQLDILISNAATGGFRPLMQASPRHFDAAMHTNTWSLVGLVQAARPLLQRSSGRGKLVALSSHGSGRALPSYGLIGASKAALEALVRHLALELGPSGINFNVVLAGLVETDSTRNLPGAEELFRTAQQRLLVGPRRLTPEDIAEAVLFLSSSQSDLVQGQTLVVDGGAALHG